MMSVLLKYFDFPRNREKLISMVSERRKNVQCFK